MSDIRGTFRLTILSTASAPRSKFSLNSVQPLLTGMLQEIDWMIDCTKPVCTNVPSIPIHRHDLIGAQYLQRYAMVCLVTCIGCIYHCLYCDKHWWTSRSSCPTVFTRWSPNLKGPSHPNLSQTHFPSVHSGDKPSGLSH